MSLTKITSSVSWAPVVIPTLCRFEHFKKCLESLMQCTGADMTDVYIGLDYPAKESHIDGWRQISSWLDEIKDSHKFRSLNVIRREKNYGIGPNGNFQCLFQEVFKSNDKLIFSEDDNIFSPAFLEFINGGLEKFKDDFSVFAINGYRHFYDIKFEGNNFFRQNVDFSAWGYGIWRNRYEMISQACNSSYWRKKALNPLNWIRIYRNGWNRVFGVLGMIKKTIVLYDNGMSVYMAVNKMDVVMPKDSMVRNMGWDGTGEHCQDDIPGLAQKHISQTIYDGNDFKFLGSGKEYYANNHKTYVTQSYGKISFWQFLKRIFSRI